MRILIFIYIILILSSQLSLSNELNAKQSRILNEYWLCDSENYLCQLEKMNMFINEIDINNEYFIVANEVYFETLMVHGSNSEIKSKQKKIDDFINNNQIPIGGRVYVASLYAWKLYSIKELINYRKSIDLFKFCIKNKSNDIALGQAYYGMGWIYDEGRAVKEDKIKALEYYLKAAEMGEEYAYKNISRLYLIGSRDIKKDYKKTLRYLKLSNIQSTTFLDLSLIDILLEKKRLPNSTRELEEWYINYFDKNEIYKNQINHDLFIDLAILYMHEKNYLNSYKYHLLNIELNSENNASTNSINNIEFIKENLNKNSINYTNLNLKKYSSAFIK